MISEILEKNFPQIETCVFDYVSSVLNNGKDDFTDSDDVFESVGEILLDVSDGKLDEDGIKTICQKIFTIIQGYVFIMLSGIQ